MGCLLVPSRLITVLHRSKGLQERHADHWNCTSDHQWRTCQTRTLWHHTIDYHNVCLLDVCIVMATCSTSRMNHNGKQLVLIRSLEVRTQKVKVVEEENSLTACFECKAFLSLVAASLSLALVLVELSMSELDPDALQAMSTSSPIPECSMHCK